MIRGVEQNTGMSQFREIVGEVDRLRALYALEGETYFQTVFARFGETAEGALERIQQEHPYARLDTEHVVSVHHPQVVSGREYVRLSPAGKAAVIAVALYVPEHLFDDIVAGKLKMEEFRVNSE